jgi:uncharacterized membrane protein YhaH (DUF805 family)
VTATGRPLRTNGERRRSPRWAAWSLWALTMLLVALAGVIVAASPAASRYAQESELGYLIFAVLFSTVGVVSVRVAGGQGATSAAGLTGPRNLWRARRA